AALREVLGAALGVAPAALRFATGEAGRPSLVADCAPGAAALDFNVSHSGSHALIAWSASTRVGVDVEAPREGFDWTPLGQSVFAPADEAAVLACAPAGRRDAFYRVWTAKEALLKVLGVGIAGGLEAFSVLDPRRPGELVPCVVDSSAPASGVAVYTAAWVDAAPGHPACLAWRPLAGE
ncbi:4'-phosphopantetheinyl transferase superfamily protein, partial [Burkholderia gladioli]